MGSLKRHFSGWKFVPIIGEEGWVVGSHATVVEATREVLSDRRLRSVRSLSRQLSGSKSIKDLWHRITIGIEDADKDVPLALAIFGCRPETCFTEIEVSWGEKRPMVRLQQCAFWKA